MKKVILTCLMILAFNYPVKADEYAEVPLEYAEVPPEPKVGVVDRVKVLSRMTKKVILFVPRLVYLQVVDTPMNVAMAWYWDELNSPY